MAWARASLSKAKTRRRVAQSRVVRSGAIDHTNAHSKQETLRSEDERKERFRYANPGSEDRGCLRTLACSCRRTGRGSGVSCATWQSEEHSVGAGFPEGQDDPHPPRTGLILVSAGPLHPCENHR